MGPRIGQRRNVTIVNTGGDPILDITGSIPVIDITHQQIHKGNHYMVTEVLSLQSAATKDYFISSPGSSVFAHFGTLVGASLKGSFRFYEFSDFDANSLGTAMAVINRNRASANAALTSINESPSVTSLGTLIQEHIMASGKSAGGTANGMEIILAQNTNYMVRITSDENSNSIDVLFDLYEPS